MEYRMIELDKNESETYYTDEDFVATFSGAIKTNLNMDAYLPGFHKDFCLISKQACTEAKEKDNNLAYKNKRIAIKESFIPTVIGYIYGKNKDKPTILKKYIIGGEFSHNRVDVGDIDTIGTVVPEARISAYAEKCNASPERCRYVLSAVRSMYNTLGLKPTEISDAYGPVRHYKKAVVQFVLQNAIQLIDSVYLKGN